MNVKLPRKETEWTRKLSILFDELNFTRADIVAWMPEFLTHYDQVIIGRQDPSKAFLDAMCSKFDVNPEWMKNDKEPILLSSKWKRSSDEEIIARIFELKGDMGTAEFADQTGLSTTSVNGILSKRTGLYYRMMRDIARGMCCSVEWLVFGNELSKDYPCDEEMIYYLRENPETRKVVSVLMGRDVTPRNTKHDHPIIETDAAWLKSIRKREHLTQMEMAERIGVSPALISQIETDRRVVTDNIRKRIVETFGESDT